MKNQVICKQFSNLRHCFSPLRYLCLVRPVGLEPTPECFREEVINTNMKNNSKICPKCQTLHECNGLFCSRKCANSRGPRSEEFKKAVRSKLSFKKICKITISPITGRILAKENPNISFWDSPCKQKFVTNLCKWFNISLGIYPDTENQLNDLRERLMHMYHDEKYSSSEIKEFFNIPLPNGHMPAFLKQLNIQRRDLTEAGKERVFRNGVPNFISKKYKCGTHIDWAGNYHFYRSSYELKMYQILDNKRKIYQTESLRIKYLDSQSNLVRVAIPDIIINNLIIEIKSNFTLDPKNMIDKFIAYKNAGYRPMLILDGKWCRWGELNSLLGV